MKKHIRILSALMALMLVMTAGMISTSAVRAPVTFGDVNHDGLDITDATIIQRTVAKLQTISPYSAFAADVNADNQVTILDATMIQQKLAGIIDEFPAGVYSYVDVYAEALTSNYSSGNARVGTPVTFTAVATGEAGPLLYQFYIDDEVVQEYSEQNTYVHTFDKAGEYVIEYSVKNRAGVEVGEYLELVVTEPIEIDELNITSIYHKGFYDTYMTFEAKIELGVAPYEFEFCLCELTEDEPIYGEVVETQDYSESNSFTLTNRLKDYHEYILYVTVRDADGNMDTDTLSFTYETPPPA